MEIHQKIKLFLIEKKVTAKQIAEEFGASQQTISNYLNGQNAMPLAFLLWLYEKYQNEMDLNAIFNRKEKSIMVSEPNSEYKKKANTKKILERVGKILDEELGV